MTVTYDNLFLKNNDLEPFMNKRFRGDLKAAVIRPLAFATFEFQIFTTH